MNSDWVTLYLFIHVFINIWWSYINHLHTRIIRSAPPDFRRRFTSHFFLSPLMNTFPPYEQYMFIHDKRSLCFLRLTNLNIHKQRKTGILVNQLLIPMEKNHFVPSSDEKSKSICNWISHVLRVMSVISKLKSLKFSVWPVAQLVVGKKEMHSGANLATLQTPLVTFCLQKSTQTLFCFFISLVLPRDIRPCPCWLEY